MRKTQPPAENKENSEKKTTTSLMGGGIFLIIFGVGSFILPYLGFQFKVFLVLFALFGSYSWTISVIGILAGITLVFVELQKTKGETYA